MAKKIFTSADNCAQLTSAGCLGSSNTGVSQPGKNPFADIPEAQEYMSEEQLQSEIDTAHLTFLSDGNFEGQSI